MVRKYGSLTYITDAEKTIRDSLKLKDMAMLDIGVGAGRTTAHFAPLVKEYLGIDYSGPMIEECRRMFPNYRFWVMDARNMLQIPSDHFDFILFSFNGIDQCGFDDRWRILSEIRRVGKVGGTVAFSSHNMDKLPKWKMYLNRIKNLHYAMVNDGTHGWKMKQFYINPLAQIRMLQDLGFKKIEIIDNAKETYYRCRI